MLQLEGAFLAHLGPMEMMVSVIGVFLGLAIGAVPGLNQGVLMALTLVDLGSDPAHANIRAHFEAALRKIVDPDGGRDAMLATGSAGGGTPAPAEVVAAA